MKIGFIGFGNMAKAIAEGIINKSVLNASNLCAYDINEAAVDNAKKLKINVLSSEKDVVKQSEFIFLCVKPQSFTQLLNDIKSDITDEKKVFSIAAGVTIKNISDVLGEVSIIRAMPNTPLLLLSGTVALCCNNKTNEKDYEFIKNIFETIGSVYDLPEDKFNEIICVSGSTPAFVYLFAKTIAEFASNNGIDYNTAMKMFCDTMVGSAKMLTQTPYSADELIKMVSSKGGTTVAALEEFKKNGLTDNLISGLNACLKRAYELSL